MPSPSTRSTPSAATSECDSATLSYHRKGDPRPDPEPGETGEGFVADFDRAYELSCRGGVPILREHRDSGFVITGEPPEPYWQEFELSGVEWRSTWKTIRRLAFERCTGAAGVRRAVRIGGAAIREARCEAVDAPAFQALEDLFSGFVQKRQEEGWRRLQEQCKDGCWKDELRFSGSQRERDASVPAQSGSKLLAPDR